MLYYILTKKTSLKQHATIFLPQPLMICCIDKLQYDVILQPYNCLFSSPVSGRLCQVFFYKNVYNNYYKIIVCNIM